MLEGYWQQMKSPVRRRFAGKHESGGYFSADLARLRAGTQRTRHQPPPLLRCLACAAWRLCATTAGVCSRATSRQGSAGPSQTVPSICGCCNEGQAPCFPVCHMAPFVPHAFSPATKYADSPQPHIHQPAIGLVTRAWQALRRWHATSLDSMETPPSQPTALQKHAACRAGPAPGWANRSRVTAASQMLPPLLSCRDACRSTTRCTLTRTTSSTLPCGIRHMMRWPVSKRAACQASARGGHPLPWATPAGGPPSPDAPAGTRHPPRVRLARQGACPSGPLALLLPPSPLTLGSSKRPCCPWLQPQRSRDVATLQSSTSLTLVLCHACSSSDAMICPSPGPTPPAAIASTKRRQHACRDA